MAPKAHSMSLLFHPKKKQTKAATGTSGGGGQNASTSQTPPTKPQATASGHSSEPRKATSAQDDDDLFTLPNTPYSEFRILSSKLQGWKYDVMKFDSRKSVDIMRWKQPIKLNRKDIRRDDPAGSVTAVPQAVGPMLGPDGKPVIGADGKMVMVDAEGKPIHAGDAGYGGAGASGSKDKGKGKDAGGRKRFQKKTRQVFLVPDEVRQLRKEERYPWVMEDSSPDKAESWVGHLEEVSKAETHGFFMPAANDAFKFVPAHRWYKFQKKIKHDLPTDTANVESLWTKSQKKDPQAWLATLNNGRGASAATAALFKQEAESKPNISGVSAQGARTLRTVDAGMDLFGEDDDGGRKARDRGAEGDLDEQVYEEDFADDDDTMNVDDAVDEEQKEIEERLKREYQRANKQNETGLDVEDEDIDMTPAKPGEKKLRKIMKKHQSDVADESDEENPYLTEEEEEDDEDEQEVKKPETEKSAEPSQTQDLQTPKASTNKAPTATNSRAASPVGSTPLGGHALTAQRATSPNPNKSRVPPPGGSRSNTPVGSRANSPTPSRATSPLANPSTPNGGTKRKAEGAPSSGKVAGNRPQAKKQKADKPSPPAHEIQAYLITYFKQQQTPVNSSDLSASLKPFLTRTNLAEIRALIQKVSIKDRATGLLTLNPKFQ